MYNCSHISSKSKNIILTSGRTGSSLIIQSLIDNGYNIISEPLNERYYKNINNKVDIINHTLEKYDMCKILYYQISTKNIIELSKKYNIILLTRDLFEVFISFKIAEVLQRWHNKGQEVVIPSKKVLIPLDEFMHTINFFYKKTEQYRKIASKEITYEEVINDWDNVINYFLKLINRPETKIEKVFLKNPENPEDFIENYKELRDIYVKLQ